MRPSAARLLLVVLFTLTPTGTQIQAQGPTAGAPAVASATGGADPWGFDDEAAEGWGDVLRPQVIALATLAGFIALALTGFVQKSVTLKYVTLAIAVGYMGFFKNYVISVVNIFGLIDWNLPIVKYNLAWYVFALFTVLSTIVWGRLYCGRICAFGALTQLMDEVTPTRLRIDLPPQVDRRAVWIRYVVLAVTVAYFIGTKDLSVYRYVEPFWMFGLFGTTGMWIALATLLLATVFVRNVYCRFLCPVGAALSVLSNLTVLRIRRWSECSTCGKCEKACSVGAIRGPGILAAECVRCDECERLYRDTERCPHWLIAKRRADMESVG